MPKQHGAKRERVEKGKTLISCRETPQWNAHCEEVEWGECGQWYYGGSHGQNKKA